MADTIAEIIDLAAYRARKSAAAPHSQDQSANAPAAACFPVALYGYWPVLVWMPFPMYATGREAL